MPSIDQPDAPSIIFDKVSLTLDGHSVLDNFSMTVNGSIWHTVLGRSGVGKTCLLKLIAGLLQPQHGSIKRNSNQPLTGEVAYMSQNDALLPWLSAIENVQLGHRLRGTRNNKTRDLAAALLEQTGLANWQAALPSTLSGGMRQRVSLARTLMEDQQIVLMDEPFSQLDAITRVELQTLAFRLLQGRTVLLVTHDPLEALRLSHAITVLGRGSTPHHLELPGSPIRNTDGIGITELKTSIWSLLSNETQAIHV